MFFKNLSPELQNAVRALTVDKVFQERFGHDPILDSLDEEKFNPSLCFAELCSAIGIPIFIDEKPYNPVNLLQYVYLWCIQNPLVKKTSREITDLDLDIFFYTLDNEIKDDAVSLASKAIGEVERRGLKIDDAKNIATYLINFSFQPLKMFPQTAQNVLGNQEVCFDVDWMTSIISKVHNVTGLSPKEIQKMSLSLCCFYYIQWSRMQGVQNISKRTSEEILQAQSERTDELIAERFIELGVIKEEEKQEFLEKIKTPPQNK